jgi:hypothetical protein
VSGGVTVTDVDSANFGGGTLTVKFTAGGQTGDRLTIRTAGSVSTSGSDVLVSGSLVGTKTGGVGTTPLVVTLNASATPSRIQSVLRQVAYNSVSENPQTVTRTVWARLTDGDGGTSAAVTKSINVSAANDVPVLTLSGSLGYVRNAPPVVLAPSALVTDPDSANFGGGQLRVWITLGAGIKNTLAIGSDFTIDASNNVKLGTTTIGKRLSNGVGTNELRIQFNFNATKSVVQQLVRAITYQNIGGSGGKRTVVFTVSDGDGGLSDQRTKTVNVT